jgi:alanyl-tRNA synthetase
MAELRDLADELRAKAGSAAIVLIAKSDGKVSLVVALTKDLVDAGKSAVEVVKKIGPIIGGGGGGRPDLAQSGGKDPSKIDEAVEAARALLKGMLE